jgi:transcriptional regulator with XRE-family HTH domain
VPERGSPNLARRRRLAAELRRLREQAGLTGDEATTRLGWASSSKLSRIERGRTGLKPTDLESLLDLYNVVGRHRQDLVTLAEESRKAGPTQALNRGLPEDHIAFAEDEAEAESIWIWEPQVIPGLLQVESYARARLQGWVTMFSLPTGEVDRRIETRRLRQEVLTRVPPLHLTAVIDESVLQRRVGDRLTMHAQLKHVAAISELPHIAVRIMPLSGEHVVGGGPFNYLRFPRIHAVPRDDVVVLEHLTGMQRIEGESDTHKYNVVFGSLLESALPERESRELIDAVADDAWNDTAVSPDCA